MSAAVDGTVVCPLCGRVVKLRKSMVYGAEGVQLPQHGYRQRGPTNSRPCRVSGWAWPFSLPHLVSVLEDDRARDRAWYTLREIDCADEERKATYRKAADRAYEDASRIIADVESKARCFGCTDADFDAARAAVRARREEAAALVAKAMGKGEKA